MRSGETRLLGQTSSAEIRITSLSRSYFQVKKYLFESLLFSIIKLPPNITILRRKEFSWLV